MTFFFSYSFLRAKLLGRLRRLQRIIHWPTTDLNRQKLIKSSLVNFYSYHFKYVEGVHNTAPRVFANGARRKILVGLEKNVRRRAHTYVCLRKGCGENVPFGRVPWAKVNN